MGTMTVADDMTRLREELNASQAAREEFVKDMKSDVGGMMGNIRDGLGDMRAGVEQMLGDFRKAHSEMAKRTKADRQGFVDGLIDMGEQSRKDRQAFVSELSKTIQAFRKEVAAEMAAAHKAFFGTTARRKVAKKPAQAAQKPRTPKKAKTKK